MEVYPTTDVQHLAGRKRKQAASNRRNSSSNVDRITPASQWNAALVYVAIVFCGRCHVRADASAGTIDRATA